MNVAQSDEVEDAETRELVEMEIREVLTEFDYNGAELPVCCGGAHGGVELWCRRKCT